MIAYLYFFLMFEIVKFYLELKNNLEIQKSIFHKLKNENNNEWKMNFMKKNIPGLGIEPQTCKMSFFET